MRELKICAPIKNFLKITDKNSLENFDYKKCIKSKNYEISLKKDAKK